MQIKIQTFLISILLFFIVGAHAQSGLNFQGVARNTNNIILASQPISLRLSIIRTSVNGITEYTETRKVTTNAQGLFAVVIGDTGAISSLGNFSNIDWKLGPKFLKIEMDVSAGNNFILLGTTQFQSVAYAQFANSVDAEKITGILPVEKGGTGVNSLASLKTALSIDKNSIGLSNVNNTADTAKPISNATKVALDRKADTADLDLKAPLASPTFTGTVAGITKSMVGLANVDNTADTAKPISNATQIALNMKVSTETFSTTIATKENTANKSTAVNLGGNATSDIFFPSQKAVKTYVDAQINSGGVADGGITTNKLADTAVTNAKIASGIDKAKVGLENVDNTADADKPISTAVADALNLKASTNVANVFTERQSINGTLGITIPNTDNHYWYFDEDEQLIFPNSTKIETGTATETIIRNSLNSDFSIITADMNGSKSWIFDKEGYMRFPGGDNIENDEYRFAINTENKRFQIQISDPINERNMFWRFWEDSSLELPNGTKIETGTNTETVIRNTPNADFVINTIALSGNDTPTSNSWVFSPSGTLTLPDNSTIGTTNSAFSIASQNGIYLNGGVQNESGRWGEIFISPTQTSGNVFITSTIEGNTDSQTTSYWSFGASVFDSTINSILTFPDGSEIGPIPYPLDDSIDPVFGIKGVNGIVLTGSQVMGPSNMAIIGISPSYWFNNNFDIDTVDTHGNFYIATSYLEDNDSDENTPSIQIVNNWKFTNQGNLIFPNLTSFTPNYEGTGGFGINLPINKSLFINTENEDDDYYEWEFDKNGILVFPDGTTLAGNYSGSTDFELNISEGAGFKITTNPTQAQTWDFDWEGSLIFPDGTTASSNEFDNSDFGFQTNNKGFTIGTYTYERGTNEFFYWNYSKVGVLTFPDGTITSGNISGTANFGFDTRANENGFSLITAGTLSGTSQLWSYNTDGSLTFPDGTITSGNISGTANFGFDTRANESGFTIITGTSSSTTQWTFDTDGSLKRNNISVLNFQMEEFKVTSQGSDITNPQSPVDIRVDSDNDYIWKFELEHTPISIRKTAFYINGTRLSQTQYSLSNNVITFDIRIWDYPPSGNYQFYIDYQY